MTIVREDTKIFEEYLLVCIGSNVGWRESGLYGTLRVVLRDLL